MEGTIPVPQLPQTVICEHTMHFNILKRIPLPLVPLYDLPTSAALIPMTVNALRTFLSNHKDLLPPPIYRRDQSGRRYRLLSGPDLQIIRIRTLRGPGIQQYSVLYPDQESATHGGPEPKRSSP